MNNKNYTTFGNAYWNDATDNRLISVISLRESNFLELKDRLDNSGINYYAYSIQGNVKLAVNEKDLDWFKSIIGEESANSLNVTKSQKSYIPPAKNIIGNKEYKYIPNKTYFKIDNADLALKIADSLDKNGIKFSGRVYGDKATLTISGADVPEYEIVQNRIYNMRSQFVNPEVKENKNIILTTKTSDNTTSYPGYKVTIDTSLNNIVTKGVNYNDKLNNSKEYVVESFINKKLDDVKKKLTEN